MALQEIKKMQMRTDILKRLEARQIENVRHNTAIVESVKTYFRSCSNDGLWRRLSRNQKLESAKVENSMLVVMRRRGIYSPRSELQ